MAERQGTNFIADMLAGARSLPVGWWLLAFAITAGTNAIDFLVVQEPDARRTAAFAGAAVLRVVLVFWLGYALLRKLAGEASPGRIGMPFLRFALFMLGVVVLMGVAAGLGGTLAGGDPRSLVAGVVTTAITITLSLLLIRLYAWQAALAVGDRSLGAAGAWRALAGEHVRLAAAYLLIAAVAILHSVLTRLAIEPGRSRETLLGLAAVDGLVSTVQLVLGCALAVAAWRVARTRAAPLRETAAVA